MGKFRRMGAYKGLSLSLLLPLTMAACGDSDDEAPEVPVDAGVVSASDQFFAAFGGRDAVDGLKGFHTASAGQRFEAVQGTDPGAAPFVVADIRDEVWYDLVEDRVVLSRQRQIFEPLPGEVAHRDIIDGTEGVIDGLDVAIPGPFPTVRTMPPVRVASARKHISLINPVILAQRALRDPSILSIDDSGPDLRVTITDTAQPAQLIVDDVTGQLTTLTTTEYDPFLGDVVLEVRYDQWMETAGVSFPQHVTIAMDGQSLHDEVRDVIAANPVFAADLFAQPTVDAPLELPADVVTAELQRGDINGQWLERWVALGLPVNAETLQTDVALQEVAPGVVFVTGASGTSVAIDNGDSYVLMEPSLQEARSIAVLDALEERWPDKPVSHVVCTHHHFDHCGGLRAYAAKGAKVVAGQEAVEFLRTLLDRPHTVVEDRLTASGRTPEVVAVPSAGLVLTESPQRIELHPVPTDHADDMIVLYLPEHRLLFSSDLYNPGFPLVAIGFGEFPKLAAALCDEIAARELDVDFLLGGHHAIPDGAAPAADLATELGRATCAAAP